MINNYWTLTHKYIGEDATILSNRSTSAKEAFWLIIEMWASIAQNRFEPYYVPRLEIVVRPDCSMNIYQMFYDSRAHFVEFQVRENT